MKKTVLTPLLLFLAGTSMFAQQSSPKPAATKPIAPLEWLVGGVWTADGSKLAPGLKIETRYTWSDNSAYVRFTTHFLSEKGTLKNYDGQFFWNPDAPGLAVWYMDARNHITQGAVTVEGDVMQLTFRAENFEGKMADMRVFVERKTKDDYSWRLEEKQAGGWGQLMSLEYLRGPEK